jgi:hypothetical protein
MIVIPTNLDYEAPPIPLAPSTPESRARFADMIASRKGPGTNVQDGNDKFFQNRHNNEDFAKMPEPIRRDALEKARKMGVSISGKVYVGGLARFANDPLAWVSDTSEVKARCAEKGWSAEGAINFEPRNPAAEQGNIERLKKRRIKRAKRQGANRGQSTS